MRVGKRQSASSRTIAAFAVTAMLGGLLVVSSGAMVASSATTTASTAVTTAVQPGQKPGRRPGKTTRARRAPDSYTPRQGVIFNSPLAKNRDVIVRHIARSLNSVTRGTVVRIASWNLVSKRLVGGMIKAHRRGASVQFIMSKAMADAQRKDGPFGTLKRELSKGNKGRPRGMASWARGCKGSCRGYGGIAHTKMYLFSKVGKASNVVMVSSANATEVSAMNQWNDIFTVTGRPKLHDKFMKIFAEMARDRKARRPYQTFDSGNDLQAFFWPYRGPGVKGNPIVRELEKVRCNGATGGAGNKKGRTVIRIAQTGILGDTGMRIAERLQQMHKRGCDIKIIFAVTEGKVRSRLAGIPMREFTQDTNGDGVYDRYLHMKSMTVSGVYGKDTSARIVWNGTANWSPKAIQSDEAGFRARRDGLQKQYAAWITRLFNNPPRDHARTMGYSSLPAEVVKVTPDGRVIGRLVRPDGTVVNPYQKIQLN